ncbi:uncharacterized protein DUF1016 [Dysgonomonas alginatilytica]|uniref:Uncharacterized protein DUF1016 n=1 Tax=Dysgonomonas alginatilytica TaxID=1605892 RepID=A0A2V3PHX7_9BACT|nr:DUF1016 N-terminal domain-containing protein [Dysgonomonas alginatilytica]PXV58879.1 uncharacterized protein DUF1016 [Dysgonomonas alginatilytica]
MATIQHNDYHHFLIEIKERIRSAQYETMKVVNKEMIQLYWNIGKQITEKQQASGLGKAVVETFRMLTVICLPISRLKHRQKTILSDSCLFICQSCKIERSK